MVPTDGLQPHWGTEDLNLKISTESIKCGDGKVGLYGFGTQNLNEFFEIIEKILRIFIESKTSFSSKYSCAIGPFT